MWKDIKTAVILNIITLITLGFASIIIAPMVHFKWYFLLSNVIMLSVYNLYGIVVGIVIAHTNLRDAQDKANDQYQQVLLENNYTPRLNTKTQSI